jgi:endonuclease/exonuclease/phosphatase family metal-dependent hydrolase
MDIFSKTSLFILMICGSAFLFSASAFSVSKSIDVSIMTFNVRVPVDPHPNNWASRKSRVIKLIKKENPDFLGLQEVLPEVVSDINNQLTEYAKIGRGRNQDSGGEGTQIFYKKKNWTLDEADTGTMQLSPTPDVPGSNGWNMQFPRIFTWGRFIEKKTGKAIYIFNTHFPLVPKERLMSSEQLLRAIADRKYPKDPVILSGDFNACESEESIQYLLGTESSTIHLKDSYRALYPDDKAGTFHDFGKQNDSCKVDYIFISEEVNAVTAGIIKDDPKIGFASDHYAVVAKLKIIATD